MKHKKVIGLTLAAGVAGIAFAPVGSGLLASANDVDLANQTFVEFLLSDTSYQGELAYTHTPLYDEDLQVNGREYIFSIGEVEGYALLAEVQVRDSVFYEVEELFYQKSSPFDDCEGLPVYITHGLYLEYRNNAFYNLSDDTFVSQETVEELAYKGFGYCGDGTTTAVTQTVSYATKQTTSYYIPYELPNLGGSINGVTGCANTAGGIVITYYDRFCENLIPDFQSYIQMGSMICYRSGGTEITNMILELYDLMGTDVDGLGTTYTGFQTGMQQYATEKGYTYSTTNLFTNGSLNMSSYQSAVQSGKPVVMFMSGFAMLGQTTTENNVDTINSHYINNTHVTVGYGYKIDNYYNASGQLIDTRRYLNVASGLVEYGLGYLNINALGTMDRAMSVNIS